MSPDLVHNAATKVRGFLNAYYAMGSTDAIIRGVRLNADKHELTTGHLETLVEHALATGGIDHEAFNGGTWHANEVLGFLPQQLKAIAAEVELCDDPHAAGIGARVREYADVVLGALVEKQAEGGQP